MNRNQFRNAVLEADTSQEIIALAMERFAEKVGNVFGAAAIASAAVEIAEDLQSAVPSDEEG